MEESKVSEKPTIRAPLKFLGRDEWLSLIPLQASDDFIIYFSLTENSHFWLFIVTSIVDFDDFVTNFRLDITFTGPGSTNRR